MAEYNGWTNRETWAVNLWINNDESVYRFIQNHVPLKPKGFALLICEAYLGEYWRRIDSEIKGRWNKVNWEEMAEAWNDC